MADAIVIYKDRIPLFEQPDNVMVLDLPAGAKILKIARQYPREQTPFIWYACNPEAAKVPTKIHVVGTGHKFSSDLLPSYIGSEIFHDGQLVFHFFVERSA